MTEAQAQHLMAIVRQRLRQAGLRPGEHPEYDDLEAERERALAVYR